MFTGITTWLSGFGRPLVTGGHALTCWIDNGTELGAPELEISDPRPVHIRVDETRRSR